MNQIFIFNPNYSAEKVLQNQKSAENDENDPTDAFNFFKIALDTQSSQKTNRKWRRKTLQEIKVDQNHSRVSFFACKHTGGDTKMFSLTWSK